MQTIEFKAAGQKLGAMHVLQSASGQKQIKLDATLPLEAADALAEKLSDLLQQFGANLGGGKKLMCANLLIYMMRDVAHCVSEAIHDGG